MFISETRSRRLSNEILLLSYWVSRAHYAIDVVKDCRVKVFGAPKVTPVMRQRDKSLNIAFARGLFFQKSNAYPDRGSKRRKYRNVFPFKAEI